MPSVAVTIAALLPEDCTSRGSQPSSPRPLMTTSLASAIFFASVRRGRIDVHVAIGADQGGDLDAIAADVFDEIAEDRKARDDF